jgi:hypothetical protein
MEAPTFGRNYNRNTADSFSPLDYIGYTLSDLQDYQCNLGNYIIKLEQPPEDSENSQTPQPSFVLKLKRRLSDLGAYIQLRKKHVNPFDADAEWSRTQRKSQEPLHLSKADQPATSSLRQMIRPSSPGNFGLSRILCNPEPTIDLNPGPKKKLKNGTPSTPPLGKPPTVATALDACNRQEAELEHQSQEKGKEVESDSDSEDETQILPSGSEDEPIVIN